MQIKRKMRNRIIAVAIIVFVFIYWRGVKATTEAKGWDCKYQIMYSICNAKNNKAKLPTFFDVIKAGVTF